VEASGVLPCRYNFTLSTCWSIIWGWTIGPFVAAVQRRSLITLTWWRCKTVVWIQSLGVIYALAWAKNASWPVHVCLSRFSQQWYQCVPLLEHVIYSIYSFFTSALDGDEWSASSPGRALPPGKGPPVSIVQEAGWAPQPVWTQRLQEKSFRLCRWSNLDCTVVQPVARYYTDWATRLTYNQYINLIHTVITLFLILLRTYCTVFF
jgi:hypothetical protein